MSEITHGSPGNPSLILIVDDDKTTRIWLRHVIEQEGYQVIEANDGETCLAVFRNCTPELVLLDAMMPNVDGFTCCERIQQLPGGSSIPVLMITGLEDQASVDRAFAAGAADYVTKPIHWAVLRQRVRRLLEQGKMYKRMESMNRELEAMNRELQRLVSVDGLTQVANRRRFDEYLQQQWHQMRREQLSLALVLCDIDFFKSYNDTYGHQAGDDCLRQVAKVIQTSAKRSIDLAARYGGEEFAVILPNTNLRGALQVAQEIQGAVKSLMIPHVSSLISQQITICLGVSSTVPSLEQTQKVLISAADKALYQAKEEGRDRYCAGTCSAKDV
jgi:diguanylate cyclase (GGDEF)-like protein